jgi:CRP-like cAMP-binding protein
MSARITPQAVLRSNFLFRELPATTLEKIAALANRRTCPAGTVIFSQGDEGDALFGLVSGEVRISSSTPDGQEAFFNVMKAGDSFGEIALIDGKPRTASAIAVAESDLMVIRRAHFLELMAREPQLPIHLLTLFCERLRWTSRMVEEAAFLHVPARLARRLLHLANPHGTAATAGTTIRLSQQDLAHFLSVSRQFVNQHLQRWRKRGWISLARGSVTIRDPEALARVADGGS